MTVEVLAIPEQPALAREGESLIARVRSLIVADDATYAEAVEYAKLGRAGIKRVTDLLGPRKADAHKSWKGLCDLESQLCQPFKDVAQAADQKAVAYFQAQEAARKAAEEAAQREQERLQREADARAEAEAARLRKEAEDAAMEAAVAAAERGDTQTATRILEAPVIIEPVVAPVMIAPPVAVQAPPKVAGYAVRQTWKSECVDLKAVVLAAASGNAAALAMLQFNQTAGDGFARSTKGSVPVPGVRFRPVAGAAGRA